MPLVLERAHALKRNRAANVDVRRGDVDAQLDPQRPPQRELPFQLSRGQHVDGVTSQLRDPHQEPNLSVTILRLCSVVGENRRGAGGGFASSV